MNVIMDVVEMTNQLSEIHPQVKTYGSLSPKLIDADSNTITLVADTELGSFWITAEMSIDQLISLIEVATKKLNKAKTLLETIK